MEQDDRVPLRSGRAERDASQLFLEGQRRRFGGSVDVEAIDPWNVPGRYTRGITPQETLEVTIAEGGNLAVHHICCFRHISVLNVRRSPDGTVHGLSNGRPASGPLR